MASASPGREAQRFLVGLGKRKLAIDLCFRRRERRSRRLPRLSLRLLIMSRMHNPAHPGEVLREYLGGMTVTDAASHLGVTRAALSRILNGNNGISADMALRLEAALGTSAEMWVAMQAKHELWEASKQRRWKVKPIKGHHAMCA